METLGIVLIVALLIAGALIVYGSIVKNAWGINLRRVSCPNCGAVAPVVRVPGSFNQAMWGGFTCAQCGTHMDKWGRRI
jgi:hypothetical protein